MSLRRPRVALVGMLATAATAAIGQVLRGSAWGRDPRWQRTNFAGAPVSLLEGLAVTAGAATAAVLSPLTGVTRPDAAAAVLSAVLPGAVGAADDLRPDAERKGLRGHLGALARGQWSTGSAKIVVLTGTGVLAALIQEIHAEPGHEPAGALGRSSGERTGSDIGSSTGGLSRVLVGGAVIAGCANLINLFDLRPGRALKVTLLTAVPATLGRRGSPVAAVAAGAALSVLPDDLAGRSMLGDAGANPLGALLGLALHQRCGPRGRVIVLLVVVAATLASERVSFTRVIEGSPVLRELDRWGRT